MALAIWKTELKPDVHTYELPKGARILSVGLQRGAAQMWFMCDPAEKGRERRLLILTGTGHEFGDHGALQFIGTMMTEDQNFVFHVLERVDA